MERLHDPEYKSVLVRNGTSNATLFFSVYSKHDPICWLAFETKKIKPQEEYFFRSKSSFKYKVRSQTKEEKYIILPPVLWEQDKRVLVTEDKGVVQDDLSQYRHEMEICIRNKYMEDETSAESRRDLYSILKLDMKEVRSKSQEEQDKIIKKAYLREMMRCHPDRNPDVPDIKLCQEVTMAYSILGDREKRAKYHDVTDYDGGWLSTSRWKAIFMPESHGYFEKWKRLGLLAVGALIGAGGAVLTVTTAGLAPPVVIACNTLGGALIGGAIQGSLRAVSYDSVANGVEVSKFLKSFTIGAAAGVVAGAMTSCIAFGLVGIGSCALSEAEIGIGKTILTVAATGAVNGATASAASNADKVIVDGEDISLKKFAFDGACGAAIGVVAGVAGGTITKGLHVAASTATVEGEAIEQVGSRLATGNLGKHVLKVRPLIKEAIKQVMTKTMDVLEAKSEDPITANATQEFRDLGEDTEDED